MDRALDTTQRYTDDILIGGCSCSGGWMVLFESTSHPLILASFVLYSAEELRA